MRKMTGKYLYTTIAHKQKRQFPKKFKIFCLALSFDSAAGRCNNCAMNDTSIKFGRNV